jgi:lipopolysaccharide export LptBFGC system permease protein LptF
MSRPPRRMKFVFEPIPMPKGIQIDGLNVSERMLHEIREDTDYLAALARWFANYRQVAHRQYEALLHRLTILMFATLIMAALALIVSLLTVWFVLGTA